MSAQAVERLPKAVSSPAGRRCHLVLQGKGGVGKTVIAGFLAEYLRVRGPVSCWDTDPLNASLAKMETLKAKPVQILDRRQLNVPALDEMIHQILTGETDAVVDTGSAPNTDVKASGYIAVGHLVDMVSQGAINSGNFWPQAYAVAPDIALNHPQRWLQNPPSGVVISSAEEAVALATALKPPDTVLMPREETQLARTTLPSRGPGGPSPGLDSIRVIVDTRV